MFSPTSKASSSALFTLLAVALLSCGKQHQHQSDSLSPADVSKPIQSANSTGGIEHRVVIPEEKLGMLIFTQDSHPGIAMVNAPLKSFEPKAAFPWHLSVMIQIRDLANNGMPTPNEQKVLSDFEAKLRPLISAHYNSIFVTRVTHNGQRELAWRIYNAEVANEIMQRLIQSKDHPRPFDFRIDHDPTWEKASWCLNAVTGQLPNHSMHSDPAATRPGR